MTDDNTCKRCNGSGTVTVLHPVGDHPVTLPCPACGGSGKK